MSEKRFDLESRTLAFTREIVTYCKHLPRHESNSIFTKQIIRSAGSIGANYIEANEALGPKDFLMRIRICRKEAKETAYWIQVLAETNPARVLILSRRLLQEAIELKKIFSAIILKTEEKIQTSKRT